MNSKSARFAIRLERVVKNYGRRPVLDGVTFEVPANCVVGLAAPNGAGKSTLIDLVAGFIKPSSGTISVLGAPARSAALRGHVAVLSQRLQLRGDERVRGFLDYLARLSFLEHAKVESALERFELSAVADMRCSELSVGFQRRVALAAALLGAPRVVLLDEPTAGLEPAAVQTVRRVIRELRHSAAVLVASPNPDELDAVCDEVLGLRAGQMTSGAATVGEVPTLLRILTRDILDPAILSNIDRVDHCSWDVGTLTLAIHLGDGSGANSVAHAVLDALAAEGVRVVSVSFLNARESILSTWMEPLGGARLSSAAE